MMEDFASEEKNQNSEVGSLFSSRSRGKKTFGKLEGDKLKDVGANLYLGLGSTRKRSENWKWLLPLLVFGIGLAFLALMWDEISPPPADSVYTEALEAKEKGEKKKAYELYLRLTKRYPESSVTRQAFYELGEIETSLRKSGDALVSYKKVIETGPMDSLSMEAHMRRAIIYQGFGKSEEALGELEIFLKDSRPTRKVLEARVLAAQLLEFTGKGDSALVLYSSVEKEDMERWFKPQVLKAKGLLFERKGDFRSAKKEYEELIRNTEEKDYLHSWAVAKIKDMK